MKWYWWALGGLGLLAITSQGNKYRVLSNFNKVRLGPNFTLDEFVVTNTGIDNIPDEAAIANLRALVTHILQPLRNYLGKPIVVTSGYRSKEVNAAIPGSSNTSQHSKGQAADFHVVGMSNQQIIDAIRLLRLPYDQLIDEYLKGKKWVHVSYNPASAPRYQWMTARDVGPARQDKYETVKIGLA